MVALNKIGKMPVVVLPLAEYERLVEDHEMSTSRNLARAIEKSRAEIKAGKVLSLREAKRRLKLDVNGQKVNVLRVRHRRDVYK